MRMALLAGAYILFSMLIAVGQTERRIATLPAPFTIGFEDGCGDSSYESQTYDSRRGIIVRILSANKVIFYQASVDGKEEKARFKVKLVGINADKNKAVLKQTLTDKLLGQDVEIFGNLRNKADRDFGGIIWLLGDENIDEVNVFLLEKGTAKYEPFESANLVSMVWPCRLEKAEERAKKAKLGVWAK